MFTAISYLVTGVVIERNKMYKVAWLVHLPRTRVKKFL